MKYLYSFSLIIFSLLFFTNNIYAKKVKFAVDMTGQTVSINGVHVSGDFQTIAGFPGGDWQPNTTKLSQSTLDTNLYSIVVDLPAFTKYEYKFVNGDQFYESEFVPVESRVGYNFNDNRWLYIDSLSDDTTYIGAILFSGNAPKGLNLLRFLVDVKYVGADKVNGLHVAGSFQNNNPLTDILYSFGSNVYEVISYVDTGLHTFKYFNGKTLATAETVPSPCANNGSRYISVTKDTVLPLVCFSSCEACIPNGINQLNTSKNSMYIYPNPVQVNSSIYISQIKDIKSVSIVDMTGKLMKQETVLVSNNIDLQGISAGIYILNISNQTNEIKSVKLVIQ